MAIYDSGKVREAARQVRSVTEQLDEAAAPMRGLDRLSEPLHGKAARQMEEQILEMQMQLKRRNAEFEEIAASLRAYADAIDAADKRIQELLR